MTNFPSNIAKQPSRQMKAISCPFLLSSFGEFWGHLRTTGNDSLQISTISFSFSSLLYSPWGRIRFISKKLNPLFKQSSPFSVYVPFNEYFFMELNNFSEVKFFVFNGFVKCGFCNQWISIFYQWPQISHPLPFSEIGFDTIFNVETEFH